MTGEIKFTSSTQKTVISGTANLASNGFNGSTEVTSMSSTDTAKWPTADGVFFGSFSTSVSSASNSLVIYRRDLNIDSTNDAPQPQSAAPAFSNICVGGLTVPPMTAGSTAVYLPLPDIPLPPTGECEFYIENKTNATLMSGYSFKVTPKTKMPS